MNKRAFGEYYSQKQNGKKEYIGLNKNLFPNDRFVFVEEQLVLDEELELLSGVKNKKYSPSGNQDLFKKVGITLPQDDFSHEQNLIIKEGAKIVLVVGCAHKGIVNILEHFYAKNEYLPNYVIGGFHIYNRSADKNEDATKVARIGNFLLNTNAKYYTCHCTGTESYNKLKFVMGERMDYLATCSQIII